MIALPDHTAQSVTSLHALISTEVIYGYTQIVFCHAVRYTPAKSQNATQLWRKMSVNHDGQQNYTKNTHSCYRRGLVEKIYIYDTSIFPLPSFSN